MFELKTAKNKSNDSTTQAPFNLLFVGFIGSNSLWFLIVDAGAALL
jgi:hypothetical protein